MMMKHPLEFELEEKNVRMKTKTVKKNQNQEKLHNT